MFTLYGGPVGSLLLPSRQLYAWWFAGWFFAYHLTLWLLPVALSVLTGRLLGLPLERAALPARRAVPWYRLLGREVFTLASVLGLIVMAPVRFGQDLWVWGRFYLAGLALFVTFKVIVWSTLSVLSWGRWLRREAASQSPDPPEPEVEALQSRVRELTERAGDPLERVLLIPENLPNRRHILAGAVGALGMVEPEFLQGGETEESAALVAAQWLARRRTGWLRFLLSPVMLVLTPALYPASFIPLLLSDQFRYTFPLLVAAVILLLWYRLTLGRRLSQLNSEADTRIAAVMEQPRPLLAAFRRMEEILSFEFTDTALSSEAAYRRALSRRRLRLEKQLGIE